MKTDLTVTRRTMLLWGLLLLGTAAGTLLAVGRAQADSLGFSLSSSAAPGTSPQDVAVTVVDEATGRPLPDATVTLSDSLEDESGANRARTDAQGRVGFEGALPKRHALTVARSGYSSLSVVGLQSPQVTVYLKPLPQPSTEAEPAILSGAMANWQTPFPRDSVTAGLVFRSLSAMDLLHFDPASLISPLKDGIDVFGRHEIPSNLVLPRQDIPILFGSVTLNKPEYRLPVPRGGQLRLASIQGTIATRDLLSLAQGGGKPSLELLNKLRVNRAGVTAPILVQDDSRANVDASIGLRAFHRVTPSLPPFRADVIVAAATDVDGDRGTLLPTDIKVAAIAGDSPQVRTVTLNAPENPGDRPRDVLTIAVGERARRVSGVVNDSAGTTVSPGPFLPVAEISDASRLPETVTLQPLAGGLSAAVYESAGSPVWYVYALPSAPVTKVPARRLPAPERISSYSVVQLDFGSFDGRSVDGNRAMRSLQRFARATSRIGAPTP